MRWIATTRLAPRWPRLIRKRTVGEVAVESLLFILGVVFFYIVDLTILSHAAPAVLRYMLDLAVYVTSHSVSSMQGLY